MSKSILDHVRMKLNSPEHNKLKGLLSEMKGKNDEDSTELHKKYTENLSNQTVDKRPTN